jgi:hypothetical protein
LAIRVPPVDGGTRLLAGGARNVCDCKALQFKLPSGKSALRPNVQRIAAGQRIVVVEVTLLDAQRDLPQVLRKASRSALKSKTTIHVWRELAAIHGDRRVAAIVIRRSSTRTALLPD